VGGILFFSLFVLFVYYYACVPFFLSFPRRRTSAGQVMPFCNTFSRGLKEEGPRRSTKHICPYPIILFDGKMVEIVESDKSGRIVIPKSLRKEFGIREKTRFLLTKRGKGQLLLQKIDVEEMARRLEEELAGKDIAAIVEAIRKEVNEKIKVDYPSLSP